MNIKQTFGKTEETADSLPGTALSHRTELSYLVLLSYNSCFSLGVIANILLPELICCLILSRSP